MILSSINKFSEYFILGKKNFIINNELIENFVNNNHFENLLISLTEINPYDVKIANEFSKLNAISSLPHLRILKIHQIFWHHKGRFLINLSINFQSNYYLQDLLLSFDQLRNFYYLIQSVLKNYLLS